MKEGTLNLLLNLAKQPIRRYEDDFMADDLTSVTSDAWDSGMEDGERSLAQDILKLEGIEY